MSLKIAVMTEEPSEETSLLERIEKAIDAYINHTLEENPRIRNTCSRLLNMNINSRHPKTLDQVLSARYAFDRNTDSISVIMDCDGSPQQYNAVSSLLDICSSQVGTYVKRDYPQTFMVTITNLDKVAEFKMKSIQASYNTPLRDCTLFTIDYRQSRIVNSGTVTITFKREIAERTDLAVDIFGSVWSNVVMNEKRLFQSEESKGAKDELVERLSNCGVEIKREEKVMLGGYEDLKDRVKRDIITPAMHPEWYEQMRNITMVNPTKSASTLILFYGPPGTGKTLMAKKIASEEGMNFLYIRAKSIHHSAYMGEPLRRLEEIFDTVEAFSSKYGKTILFVDEIDDLLIKRSEDSQPVALENRRVANAFLTRVEGLKPSNSGLIVIGATNSYESLDKALKSRIRHGIEFYDPKYDDRVDILSLYAKHLPRKSIDKLASMTEGFSGRSIDIVRQAAENAAIYDQRERLENGESVEPPSFSYYEKAIADERKLKMDGNNETKYASRKKIENSSAYS